MLYYKIHRLDLARAAASYEITGLVWLSIMPSFQSDLSSRLLSFMHRDRKKTIERRVASAPLLA
jgi:hypothetical protein